MWLDSVDRSSCIEIYSLIMTCLYQELMQLICRANNVSTIRFLMPGGHG